MADIRYYQSIGYRIEKIAKRHSWYGVHVTNGSNYFIFELDSLDEFSDEELEEYYAN